MSKPIQRKLSPEHKMEILRSLYERAATFRLSIYHKKLMAEAFHHQDLYDLFDSIEKKLQGIVDEVRVEFLNNKD